MKPFISIIIPLYNKEAIIERTILSVLSQSFQNFEMIIVNDGSTDGSMDVVRSIHDDRIIIMEQENGGPSKARNTGVANSHGVWILFLDADDELAEGALEHFATLINNNHGIEMFCCEYLVKKGNELLQPFVYRNEIIDNGYKAWFFRKIFPRTGATVYSRNLVLKCPFNEQIRRYEDLECLNRMFRYSSILISHHIVLTMNVDFSSASAARKTISEDFLGHLDFKNKSFWEYMCLYQFYLGEREHYPEKVKKLYPHLHRRYDLLLLYKVLQRLNR